MGDSTTVTVPLSRQTEDRLTQLAETTHRSRSVLAAEAIEQYVERQLDIVAAIEEGLADARAGRTVPHETVMAEMRPIIDAAKARQ